MAASPHSDGDGASPVMIAWTTVSSPDDAARLANGVVGERLVACAQLDGPVTSHYHWQGKLCSDTEYRITLKFPAKNCAVIEKWIHEHHPYETPQWIVVTATHVSESYRAWVAEVTQSDGVQDV